MQYLRTIKVNPLNIANPIQFCVQVCASQPWHGGNGSHRRLRNYGPGRDVCRWDDHDGRLLLPLRKFLDKLFSSDSDHRGIVGCVHQVRLSNFNGASPHAITILCATLNDAPCLHSYFNLRLPDRFSDRRYNIHTLHWPPRKQLVQICVPWILWQQRGPGIWASNSIKNIIRCESAAGIHMHSCCFPLNSSQGDDFIN